MIIIPDNIQTIFAIKGKEYIIIGWIHGNYEIICMSHCWPFLRYNHGAAIFFNNDMLCNCLSRP